MSDSIRPPECKNPDHPGPRDVMRCAEEPTGDRPYYVFWCPVCADALHVKSIQVFTAGKFKQELRKTLGEQGRLMTAPPKIRKRTTFAR